MGDKVDNSKNSCHKFCWEQSCNGDVTDVVAHGAADTAETDDYWYNVSFYGFVRLGTSVDEEVQETCNTAERIRERESLSNSRLAQNYTRAQESHHVRCGKAGRVNV